MPRWGTKRTGFGNVRIRRMKFQKRKLIFIGILISLLLMLQTFIYIEKHLEPILISIAKARVKQIATNAVNDAISKKIAQNTNFKELIIFEMDQNGKIRAATFNYSEFARIVGESTERVENTLKDLEKIEEKIKLGAAFNSDLLADIGPEIPISMYPIGSVEVNPYPMYQNAGINVVIMTVMLEIRAEVQVVIPFVTEPTVITSALPIAQTQIFGDVPQFYFDGKGTYYNTSPGTGNYPMMPPIQISPGVGKNSGSEIEVNQNSVPTISNHADSIPGLEEFYPVIPRREIPSNGRIQ